MIFVLKGRRKIESDVDVDLLLYHLAPMIYIHVDVKDGQSAFTMRSDWIIKVGNDTPPSVEEIKIFQLRQFHRQLQSMIDEIGRIMISHAQKAKHALTTNDKSLALFELRRKKLLEANRERRMVSLNQIGDILNSINQAKSDAQVLEVYRAGEATLRTALQSLPTKEIVSDLVTGLQVLLTDQVEISTLLSSPQNVNFSDEASLEAELDELLISVKTPSLIDLMPSVADMSKDLKAKISEDSMNIFEPLSVHLEPDNTEDICDRLDRVRIQS